MGSMHMRWQCEERTWLNTFTCSLFLVLYADDKVVLDTTCRQLTRMVEEVRRYLSLIGLRLSPTESQALVGPCTPPGRICVHDGCGIKRANSFVYLGILMGFSVTCVEVAMPRITRAVSAFHGYYRILSRVGRDVRSRLRLFHTVVTSNWRWMSPGIRPTRDRPADRHAKAMLEATWVEYRNTLSGHSLI